MIRLLMVLLASCGGSALDGVPCNTSRPFVWTWTTDGAHMCECDAGVMTCTPIAALEGGGDDE